MSETIICQIKENIALITLNRPKQLNAFSGELVDAFNEALDKASQDNKVRTVVITGEGRAFCAGGDLDFLNSLSTANERRLFIKKVGNIVKKIYHMPKPVIAMVNGVAAGAGCNLALGCDLIFASDKANFIQSFAKVGLSPDCGGFYHLAKIVGLPKAKEIMFTAEPLSAKECLNLNLINQVLDQDSLYEQVMEFASALSKSAPLAIEMTKKALNNYSSTLEDSLEFESLATSALLGTKDFAEGVKAFKEKRPPVFIGE